MKTKKKGGIQADFIPGGERVDNLKGLNFRNVKEDEIYQCCAQTNFDPQSGPIWCGAFADIVADTEGGYVGLCARHNDFISVAVCALQEEAKYFFRPWLEPQGQNTGICLKCNGRLAPSELKSSFYDAPQAECKKCGQIYLNFKGRLYIANLF
jgi:ribosomal protein L40E